MYAAESNDAKILADLHFYDFSLTVAFESAADVNGAQERILAFVQTQDLESSVNAGLIEKYELTGIATLAQEANAPDLS